MTPCNFSALNFPVPVRTFSSARLLSCTEKGWQQVSAERSYCQPARHKIAENRVHFSVLSLETSNPSDFSLSLILREKYYIA